MTPEQVHNRAIAFIESFKDPKTDSINIKDVFMVTSAVITSSLVRVQTHLGTATTADFLDKFIEMMKITRTQLCGSPEPLVEGLGADAV